MTRRSLLATTTALLLAASLAACGGDGDAAETTGSGSGSAGGLTPVTFASLSVAQAAPVALAQEQGFFADHGLDVEIQYLEAATMIPSLVSGQVDIGWLNAPAVLVARSNGLPVQSVITMSTVSEDPADFPIQLMVPVGSEITSPADLVGRTVAVDTLFQLPDLGMRRALLASGVDPADINFVEIPFPEMGQALELGRVDAANVTEPFGAIIRDSGIGQDLLSASVGQEVGSPQSVLISTEQYISGNADTVTTFQDAIREATDYALANDEAVRQIVTTFTQLDPSLAAKIRFAPFSNDDSAEGWHGWADLLETSGAVTSPVDVDGAYLQ